MNCLKPVGLIVALSSLIFVVGCTQRDASPPTPVENTATPTYRSTTNSYEMNTSPKYTQAGVNGGEPTTLPAIASPDRFSQNTPLASAVNSVLHVNQTVDTRYISVFSKAGTIKLLGTVRKSDLPTVLSIVKKVPGVKSIDNQLQIK